MLLLAMVIIISGCGTVVTANGLKHSQSLVAVDKGTSIKAQWLGENSESIMVGVFLIGQEGFAQPDLHYRVESRHEKMTLVINGMAVVAGAIGNNEFVAYYNDSKGMVRKKVIDRNLARKVLLRTGASEQVANILNLLGIDQ
jgi:hypothetical protein